MVIPEWVNRDMYPFATKQFAVAAGNMSYVCEGAGEPIVMVPGNPYWSFEYRHLIRNFAPSHRCIAPDHIGFGLSDKPAEWDYLPQHHAENLEALLESLDLQEITMVVNDWGGPIGLSYAISHPDRVKQIVVTNSWCWSVSGDWYYRLYSALAGGSFGRMLTRRYNFFARTMVKALFGDRRRLTPEVHEHIVRQFETPDERKGCAVFPGQVVGASQWLAGLWERRAALGGKGTLLAWGMKDLAFREKELATFAEAFPEARIVRFHDAGHNPAEERGADLAREMEPLLRRR